VSKLNRACLQEATERTSHDVARKSISGHTTNFDLVGTSTMSRVPITYTRSTSSSILKQPAISSTSVVTAPTLTVWSSRLRSTATSLEPIRNTHNSIDELSSIPESSLSNGRSWGKRRLQKSDPNAMSDRSYKRCDSRDCLRVQSTQSSRSASFSNSRSEYDRNLRNTDTGVALHEVIGMTDVSSPSQHSRSSVKSNLQPLDFVVSQPKSSVLITSSKQNKSSFKSSSTALRS